MIVAPITSQHEFNIPPVFACCGGQHCCTLEKYGIKPIQVGDLVNQFPVKVNTVTMKQLWVNCTIKWMNCRHLIERFPNPSVGQVGYSAPLVSILNHTNLLGSLGFLGFFQNVTEQATRLEGMRPSQLLPQMDGLWLANKVMLFSGSTRIYLEEKKQTKDRQDFL